MEGGKGGEFAWRDGPLLAALKAGHWVVLDEVGTTSHLKSFVTSKRKFDKPVILQCKLKCPLLTVEPGYPVGP